MARKIEIGLELEGQDLIDFYEYLEKPHTPTPAAVASMKRAMKMKAERDALLCK